MATSFHADVLVPILLMEEILHQLIGGLSHFYRVLYIPGGAGFFASTVGQHKGTKSSKKQLCLWRMHVQPIWVSTRIIHLYPNIQTMFGRLPSPSPHFQNEVGWGHYNLPKTNESPYVCVYITTWNPTKINMYIFRYIYTCMSSSRTFMIHVVYIVASFH